VLKKCRDEHICSVAEHFFIWLQWHLPFVATFFHRIQSVMLYCVLPDTLHRVSDCVLMRKARGYSAAVRLRGPHLGNGGAPNRATTTAV
jgi:hypothetical protein